MTFLLSDDQTALRTEVRRFLTEQAPMDKVRADVGTDTVPDVALWQRLGSELGLTGIGVPEEYGGAGATFLDLAVVMEELGRALTPVPFLSSAVLATRVLLESGDREACSRWLPDLAAAATVATVALVETTGDWTFGDLGVTARPAAQGHAHTSDTGEGSWVLTGDKHFVTDGSAADLLLVLAMTAKGPTLFGVERGTSVSSVRNDVLDPTRELSTVVFADTPAQPVGPIGGAEPVLDRALAVAGVALACEQVGGAATCQELAVEYAKTRVQFDRPIGSFQAIKHMLVERMVDNESARNAAYYAAWAADQEPHRLPQLASLSKAFASEAYVEMAKATIQVHGGIGFTWEHDAHFHLKRAVSTKALLGSPESHKERIAVHLLDDPAEATP